VVSARRGAHIRRRLLSAAPQTVRVCWPPCDDAEPQPAGGMSSPMRPRLIRLPGTGRHHRRPFSPPVLSLTAPDPRPQLVKTHAALASSINRLGAVGFTRPIAKQSPPPTALAGDHNATQRAARNWRDTPNTSPGPPGHPSCVVPGGTASCAFRQEFEHLEPPRPATVEFAGRRRSAGPSPGMTAARRSILLLVAQSSSSLASNCRSARGSGRTSA